MENFFGILKSELLNLKEFENVEHFKPDLAKHIVYHNQNRIRAKLKAKRPVQYRAHALQAA
ncbi:hypothetical protein D0466_02915 [Peribacillus glennii]|uniref:Integrase catalytic domain-containing protein n=1 Tax=Peribacillus glennii TaxID=2303991 RepID=A0A372LF22_9BACI|nr:hypothetical protein D0466_02915 [Peribacillus glennii]